jgi:nucleotide-binding universal stress UspA family protein
LLERVPEGAVVQINRILCPVDFSDFSRHALDHAIAIAHWYGSAITALHVVTPARTVPLQPYVGPAALQPLSVGDVNRARLRAEMHHFVAQEAPAALAIEIRVEDGLHVYREILVQAQRLSADLIVMGTHGRSGFERLFLGSVAERVLRSASCPVMTVPPQVPDAVPAGIRFQRILCPIDFSPSSDTALQYAISLAQQAKTELIVMHAVELLPDLTEPPLTLRLNTGELVKASHARLSAMVPDSVRQSCKVVEEVTVGTAYREILRVAAEQSVELIVIGIRGRNAVDALLHGSTAEHVERRAACPVLTLRPAGD